MTGFLKGVGRRDETNCWRCRYDYCWKSFSASTLQVGRACSWSWMCSSTILAICCERQYRATSTRGLCRRHLVLSRKAATAIATAPHKVTAHFGGWVLGRTWRRPRRLNGSSATCSKQLGPIISGVEGQARIFYAGKTPSVVR